MSSAMTPDSRESEPSAGGRTTKRRKASAAIDTAQQAAKTKANQK